MKTKPSSLVIGVGLVVGIAAGRAAPLVAQTRFLWPDTTIDFANYETVEDCEAIVERVTNSVEVARRISTGVWLDTLPAGRSWLLLAASANETEGWALRARSIVLTARGCAARLIGRAADPSAPDPRDFPFLLSLYLAADRDADAAALITRRLAAVPVADSAERRSIEEAALWAYGEARPIRLAVIEQIFGDRLRGSVSVPERIVIHGRLMSLYAAVGDTTKVLAHTRQVLDEAGHLPEAELAQLRLGPEEMEKQQLSRVYQDAFRHILRATSILHHRELLDSLRRGTLVWLAFERALEERALGPRAVGQMRGYALPDSVPAVAADFWFRREAGESTRPTLGKVALVVTVEEPDPSQRCLPVRDTREHAGNGGDGPYYERDECWALFATLRRLGQRFPRLEITLITSTHGFFVNRAEPDPAAEAELIRYWLHDVQRLSGALAVRATPLVRLPEPDGRWLFVEPGNANAAMQWAPPGGTAVLVDPDGRPIFIGRFEGRWTSDMEVDLTEKIDALMQRPVTASGGVTPVRGQP